MGIQCKTMEVVRLPAAADGETFLGNVFLVSIGAHFTNVLLNANSSLFTLFGDSKSHIAELHHAYHREEQMLSQLYILIKHFIQSYHLEETFANLRHADFFLTLNRVRWLLTG